jgi:phosphomevalonate kinase
MPPKANATTAASFRRHNHRMDQAMKAGIGATACSVLIVAIVLLAMHTLPVSIG